MTTERLWAVSYMALVVALISLAVYTRAVDQATQECIGRVVQANIESSQTRSVAANHKDRAELRRLEAMRNIVRLRIPGQRPPTDAETLEFAREYDRASLESEAELRRVLEVRKDNPVPNFEHYCRDTARER